MRQNKGSILKASVDYIKKLRKDQERSRQVEEKLRQAEMEKRKMYLRMQVMFTLFFLVNNVICLSIGTPKMINFPFVPNGKSIIFRCLYFPLVQNDLRKIICHRLLKNCNAAAKDRTGYPSI